MTMVLVLDALNQAIGQRLSSKTQGLIHHSDRGAQYLSLNYTERLAQAGMDASVGSVKDSYEDALAESVIGLFKAQVEWQTTHVGALVQRQMPAQRHWIRHTQPRRGLLLCNPRIHRQSRLISVPNALRKNRGGSSPCERALNNHE